MSEQTLKFGDIVVNKREFHASKQAIAVTLVDTSKIVVSDKFKHMVMMQLDLCVLYYLKSVDT